MNSLAHKYFSENIYTPYKTINNENKIEKYNIIILIMESYSKEFIGYYNKNDQTPFLDSLIKYSLIFPNAYANGIKSHLSIK